MKKLDESQKNLFMFTLQIAIGRAYNYGIYDRFKIKETGSKEAFDEWRDQYIKDIAESSGLV